MFNEYFHGDNGAGLGASHQTGWTGLVADLIRRRHGAVPSIGDAAAGDPAGRTAGVSGRTAAWTARPGVWFPLGATARRRRHELRRGVGDRRRRCCCACSTSSGAETRVPLPDCDAGVWHGFVPGVGAGQAYGYRATGPYDPARGAALQPGQAAARPVRPGDHRRGPVRAGGARPRRPTTPTGRALSTRPRHVPRSLVRRPGLRLGRPSPRRPRRYADTVIYEVHVKGFTATHPDVPPELRGTYAGLGHEAAIAHLRRPGRHRGRAAAGAPQRARGVPRSTGA